MHAPRVDASGYASPDDAFASGAQRYLDVAFDNAPIGAALFNCAGEYVRVNAALCKLLGRSPEELIGRRDQELTYPDDRAADLAVAEEIFAGRYDTHQCEKRFVRPDGSIVWTLANLTFLRDEHGGALGWVAQFQDVTVRREAEELLRLAFDRAPIGMALVAPDGGFLRVNDTLCDMLGYSELDLLSLTFQDITHPDDLDADVEHVRAMLAGEIRSYDMEKRYIRADGSQVWTLLSVSLVRDDAHRPRYFVSQIQDIDQRKRAQAELEHLANHDPLTGALNRRAWDRELARAVMRAERSERPFAVALIDFDQFKRVNDTHGHDAGDCLLKDATHAWQSQLRGDDLLARVGGDEFAILLAGCEPDQSVAILRRLERAGAYGCSMGVAVWEPGDDAAGLMRRADRALYADKASGAGPMKRSAGTGRERRR
jgi:diguanylate cyclase (GGDEF)-like protein/PAS domain S-box-containing protein